MSHTMQVQEWLLAKCETTATTLKRVLPAQSSSPNTPVPSPLVAIKQAHALGRQLSGASETGKMPAGKRGSVADEHNVPIARDGIPARASPPEPQDHARLQRHVFLGWKMVHHMHLRHGTRL